MRTIHNLNVNSLDPIETFTIKEIAKKLKDTGKFNLLSDKEFDEMILSRRPMELMLVGQAFGVNLM